MSAINAHVNLLDLTPVQLKEFVKLIDEPASAADQILRYIYREYAAGFTEMADLDSSLQQKLTTRADLGELESLEELVSSDAQTRKVLFRLADNNTIESTIMFFKNPGPAANGALSVFPARLVAPSAAVFAPPDIRGLCATSASVRSSDRFSFPSPFSCPNAGASQGEKPGMADQCRLHGYGRTVGQL